MRRLHGNSYLLSSKNKYSSVRIIKSLAVVTYSRLESSTLIKNMDIEHKRSVFKVWLLQFLTWFLPVS